jgi:lysophospholipase L1-like esterase
MNGGYRVELFRLAHSAGHDITFTGTQAPNGPSMVDGAPFPRNHAGISGQTVQQIADRIPTPDLQEIPHIILVHAGTNDMWNGPTGVEGRLADLVDELIDQAPDALIVVAQIIPWDQYETQIKALNASIPTMVQERADAGAHVLYVDLWNGFPSGELADGIHPTATGYEWMATKWYGMIEEYLP